MPTSYGSGYYYRFSRNDASDTASPLNTEPDWFRKMCWSLADGEKTKGISPLAHELLAFLAGIASFVCGLLAFRLAVENNDLAAQSNKLAARQMCANQTRGISDETRCVRLLHITLESLAPLTPAKHIHSKSAGVAAGIALGIAGLYVLLRILASIYAVFDPPVGGRNGDQALVNVGRSREDERNEGGQGVGHDG